MQEQEVLIAYIASLGLFVAGTLVIVLFLYRYQKRKLLHQQELLKTEIEVQEQTRSNLASDLHDNIGQLLSLTNVILASINIKDTEKSEQKVVHAKELVTKSIQELRLLSKLIQGEQLIQQGLVAAIKQEVSWLMRCGFRNVEFEEKGYTLETADSEKDLFIYRLLQETLNNIIKHAEADSIFIRLGFEKQDIIMTITDNGKGFDIPAPDQEKKGMGLANMRKRLMLLNGNMQIESSKNNGTIISFNIPYPRK